MPTRAVNLATCTTVVVLAANSPCLRLCQERMERRGRVCARRCSPVSSDQLGYFGHRSRWSQAKEMTRSSMCKVGKSSRRHDHSYRPVIHFPSRKHWSIVQQATGSPARKWRYSWRSGRPISRSNRSIKGLRGISMQRSSKVIVGVVMLQPCQIANHSPVLGEHSPHPRPVLHPVTLMRADASQNPGVWGSAPRCSPVRTPHPPPE